MKQKIFLSVGLGLPGCHLIPLNAWSYDNTCYVHWALVVSSAMNHVDTSASNFFEIEVDQELPVKHYLTPLPRFSPDKMMLEFPQKVDVEMTSHQSEIPVPVVREGVNLKKGDESFDKLLFDVYHTRFIKYYITEKILFEEFKNITLSLDFPDDDDLISINIINENTYKIVNLDKPINTLNEVFIRLMSGLWVHLLQEEMNAMRMSRAEKDFLLKKSGILSEQDESNIVGYYRENKDKYSFSGNDRSWYQSCLPFFKKAAVVGVAVTAAVVASKLIN